MSMETTCPKCHTTFRVTTEQLNAHQGDVRCGICAFQFNAFDSLAPARETAAMPDAPHEPEPLSIEPALDEVDVAQAGEVEVSLDFDKALEPIGEPAPIPPAESIPEVEQASTEDEEISLDLDQVLDVAAEPEPTPLPSETEEVAMDDMADAADAASMPAPEQKIETAPEPKPIRVPAEVQAIEDIYADFVKAGVMPTAATDAPVEQSAITGIPEATDAVLDSAEIVSRPAVEVWEAAEPPRSRRLGWLFGLGALPLLLLLAMQTGYFYRVELASRMPATRPFLEQACGWVGCAVPLPHNADLLKIESSDLEADTEHPSQVTLATTVSNRANYRQTYPLLELTLTNPADQAIARRVFAPSEYLPAGSNIKGGMAANSEAAVRLSLDLGELNAVGYRLYVFYAAQR